MTEEQRHQLSKAAGLTKLFNDALHGKPEVQAQAIESLHWVASHAAFLLDLIGEGDGVEADQRRVLIKEHSRQSIEWPVLLHADNLGKKHQAPPEVLKMRELPLGKATPLKLYGEGGKRGAMKDVLFEFLLSFVRRVEGIQGLKKEVGESPFLTKTFKRLDPTGKLRDLPPLTAGTAKKWAGVVSGHCEATGSLHDPIPDSVRKEIKARLLRPLDERLVKLRADLKAKAFTEIEEMSVRAELEALQGERRSVSKSKEPEAIASPKVIRSAFKEKALERLKSLARSE